MKRPTKRLLIPTAVAAAALAGTALAVPFANADEGTAPVTTQLDTEQNSTKISQNRNLYGSYLTFFAAEAARNDCTNAHPSCWVVSGVSALGLTYYQVWWT